VILENEEEEMLKNRIPFVILLASTALLATGIAPGRGNAAIPPEQKVQANAGSASASWLSPEIWLSGGTPAEGEGHPAIDHNSQHDEYLVVWHNNRPVTQDIYARRVSERGGLRSWFSVSSCSNCLYPAVAYNHTNDEYLIVWSQYNVSQWEIWGKIIPWNGPGGNAPFQIASWTSMNLQVPAVAWNSYRNEYMVVWQTSLVSSGQLLGIGRRRLSSTGAALSNADYITGASPTNQGFPDLVYNLAADGYLVVWAEPGASAINVFGGRLNREGTLQGSKFAVDVSSNEQEKPAITTNEQDRYLVVWQEMVSGDWDIHGKEVNSATGAPLPPVYLIAILYGVDETTPDVACNGGTGEYLTVWQQTTGSGEAINAVRWGTNVTTYSFEVAAGGLGDNGNPAVASDIPGYLVAYEWQSWTPGSDSDIYGRRWVPSVVFLPAVVRNK
jgi:hypothetical protein